MARPWAEPLRPRTMPTKKEKDANYMYPPYTASRFPCLLAAASNLFLPPAPTSLLSLSPPSHRLRVRPSPDLSSSAAWPTALSPPRHPFFVVIRGHPLRSFFCQYIRSLISE